MDELAPILEIRQLITRFPERKTQKYVGNGPRIGPRTNFSADPLIFRIQAGRVRKGLSQTALSEMIGVDRSYISQIESRGKLVSAPVLCRIAWVLADTFGEVLEYLADADQNISCVVNFFLSNEIFKEREEFAEVIEAACRSFSESHHGKGPE